MPWWKVSTEMTAATKPSNARPGARPHLVNVGILQVFAKRLKKPARLHRSLSSACAGGRAGANDALLSLRCGIATAI